MSYAFRELFRLDDVDVLPAAGGKEVCFADLFPAIGVPSPLQDWAANVRLAEAPQIFLLEDVTGAGKTEAAVMLAHRLMAAGRADGFFIGLPTMATANAMYSRIAGIYARLFVDHPSLVLAHGQRSLVEAFAASVLPSGQQERDREQLDETATARCSAWLADHNKRALLAPAGVGTLDQALLAVLHSKHQSLRLLGLFRKVLIVDEVHACDAYMQGVLEALLEFHSRVGGSAVLLSATLPQRMKQALIGAFARGHQGESPSLIGAPYPMVTSWSPPFGIQEKGITTRESVKRSLAVRYECDEQEIVHAIERMLCQGRCVCWIRNTVADAISAYVRFQERLPREKLTLFHARFALRDRLNIEDEVLRCFGKDSTPQERGGRLVIATQVAEQSLDVDWDFVVSDLAPIDRLIQRAGRLQRHSRDALGRRARDLDARDERGEPCLWVFGPAWTDEPQSNWFKQVFEKASAVYPNHAQVWLTAGLLQRGRIEMPGHAREFIEAVFGADVQSPAALEKNASAAEGQGYADASIAQQNAVKIAQGYTRGGIDWWSEAKTPSRLGEEQMNVLLARWQGDELKPWVDGSHGWAYSSVRVAERLIARGDEPASPARSKALEQVLPQLPGKGKWSVLIPLDRTENGWQGAAWAKPRRDGDERRLTWLYDARLGLRQGEDNGGEDE